MVSLHVKDVKFGLQRGHTQLVHVDVRAVEFQTANTVRNVCVPSQAIRPQVKQLHITVVVTCSQAPLLLVVGISEGDGPAVRLNGFTLRRLKTYNRRLLPWVPNANTAISASCDELGCSEF
jgi:hypothetical protein